MESNEGFKSPEMEKYVEKYIEEHELKHFHFNLLERSITIVIGAMGLIAALAWDEALKHLFDKIFGEEKTLNEEFFYALIVTAFAALISLTIGRAYAKRKRRMIKK